MNPPKKWQFSLASLVLAVFASASCFAHSEAIGNKQRITIQAKRLSSAEKAQYDREQSNLGVQRIIISAKRLSAADKALYDETRSHAIAQ